MMISLRYKTFGTVSSLLLAVILLPRKIDKPEHRRVTFLLPSIISAAVNSAEGSVTTSIWLEHTP